ncbi:MAG: DUF2279 domain-containing protein [Bacteroidetes bacterium]|nr:DUF2279 domain-containing protein [Bacteroidota bacterium]
MHQGSIRSGSLLLAVLAVAGATAHAQGNDRVDTTTTPARADTADHISVPKLAIVGGITGAGFVAGYFFQTNLWWKGEKSAFHFDWDHDWRYALGSDKYGHFYFPYAVAIVYGQAFQWCGMDSAASLWAGGGIAMAHQTFVEIRDGFSKEWGFSWGDFGADLLGSAYPIARHYIPALRDFTFKVSFYPSMKFRNGAYRAIIDDYESQYQWMSVNVRNLLPTSWRAACPAWLNIAVGHSVKDLDEKGGGRHEFYLSLDWNLEGLPGDGWLWNLLKKNLNLYHLPAPAVRISPGAIWYGVHF